MKTAMQEMIDWLKSQEAICLKNSNQHEADILNGHILVSLTLLEKEKQQIIKAFDDCDINSGEDSLDGTIYYNKKYKQ